MSPNCALDSTIPEICFVAGHLRDSHLCNRVFVTLRKIFDPMNARFLAAVAALLFWASAASAQVPGVWPMANEPCTTILHPSISPDLPQVRTLLAQGEVALNGLADTASESDRATVRALFQRAHEISGGLPQAVYSHAFALRRVRALEPSLRIFSCLHEDAGFGTLPQWMQAGVVSSITALERDIEAAHRVAARPSRHSAGRSRPAHRSGRRSPHRRPADPAPALADASDGWAGGRGRRCRCDGGGRRLHGALLRRRLRRRGVRERGERRRIPRLEQRAGRPHPVDLRRGRWPAHRGPACRRRRRRGLVLRRPAGH